MNKLLLPISVILLSCCCCPLGAVAPNFVKEEPRQEDIIGVYELSSQRVVSESVVEDKVSYIELYPDQTCNMVNFPVFVENTTFEYEFQELYTGKCNWRIGTIGSTNSWNVTPIWGVCFENVTFESPDKCASLLNNKSLYDLEFVFGDPDSNRIMTFSRITPK